MEGIRNEQQTIQNEFHEFGSEVIKGFAVDTGSIAGVSQSADSPIAQLEAKMAKQQAEMSNKLNTIMAALGNCAPAPAPSPTQPTAPTTATNINQGVMNGTGTVDTTFFE